MKMVLGVLRPEMAMKFGPKERGPNTWWGPSLDSPRLVVGLPCAVRNWLLDWNSSMCNYLHVVVWNE